MTTAKNTAPDFQPFGSHGVEMAIAGDFMHFRVPITDKARKSAPLSSSAKSLLLGNTGGFQQVPGLGDVKVNLTATCKLAEAA